MDPSVLALLVLLGGLAWVPTLIKRRRGAAPDGVRVVARTALHKNAVVAVIAVGRRRLLVGASERGVQLLAELEAAEDASATAARGSGRDGIHLVTTTADDPSCDRMDAVAGSHPKTHDVDAPLALTGLHGLSGTPIRGPGTGLIDRLRGMTVRTPAGGRPSRVPLHR